MTKTIEYPIEELVRFEMDKNKIWRLRYENLPSIPFDRNRFDKTDKEYEDFILQTHKFCEKQNFSLEGDGYVFTLCWNRGKPNLDDGLPTLLFPYCSEDFVRSFWVVEPPPYYGNPHYKKYIEDNNGKCLLPLPEDMKWWEV